ncbi:mucin-7-like [Dermacentor albipictus]|uniref:mucin-7-like n=1 Tax=Dermacentor albipictus TaxID=60249 RepID=UPI0038FC8245
MVKTPLDVLHPHLRSTVIFKQLKQKLAADQGCRPGPLPESRAPVFARNFHPGPPWSAGQVVSPASASSLLVHMPDGAMWHRHADPVKPRLGTLPAPSTTTSEFQRAGGLAAAPVNSSGAPPTSYAATVASGVAPVGPVLSPAPLTRPTTTDPPDGARLAQAAPGVATPNPSTPVPKQRTRRRRPPDRYSPG